MMTRFFLILLLVFVMACSGNNPILNNVKPAENRPYNSFNIEYGTAPHDTFPMHYVAEKDTLDKNEFSYFFIRNEGDTIVWEEGTIRTP